RNGGASLNGLSPVLPNAWQRLQLTSASAFPSEKSSARIGVPQRTMPRIAIALRIAPFTPDGRIVQREISAHGFRSATRLPALLAPPPRSPGFQAFRSLPIRLDPCLVGRFHCATENVIQETGQDCHLTPRMVAPLCSNKRLDGTA